MGEEEATMRERLVEAMARALFAQGEREDGNPDFSDTSATVDWWFSLREDAYGEDADCYRICQEYRRAASAALDAALDVLETPSEEMWGGLARQLIMWMDMGNKTPAGLLKHLEQSGRDIPDWLRDEPEMQALNHVPSKGTRAVLVFRAMLATLRSPKI